MIESTGEEILVIKPDTPLMMSAVNSLINGKKGRHKLSISNNKWVKDVGTFDTRDKALEYARTLCVNKVLVKRPPYSRTRQRHWAWSEEREIWIWTY